MTGLISADVAVAVELTPEEVDAVVYCIACKIVWEAEALADCRLSPTPCDLDEISERSSHIARLAAIGDQLRWGRRGSRACEVGQQISSTRSVWLDLMQALEEQAQADDDEMRFGEFRIGVRFDSSAGACAFAAAARAIAGACDCTG
jgi:hypothetical protein